MGLGAVGCIPAREFEESAPLLWLAEIEICSDWLNQAIAREREGLLRFNRLKLLIFHMAIFHTSFDHAHMYSIVSRENRGD
jgi:hypothetical protein